MRSKIISNVPKTNANIRNTENYVHNPQNNNKTDEKDVRITKNFMSELEIMSNWRKLFLNWRNVCQKEGKMYEQMKTIKENQNGW